MVVFPNAKINLGLNIIDKRPDGYHSIESCFYPIPLTDALEVIESDILSFASSGIEIPGNKTDNLCLKAYHLVKESYDVPTVAIHLHKHIPIGAGLGGGSADGAFMINLLNEKFNVGMSVEEMEKLAAKLGSDCPFFIKNEPVFVEGTGNLFSEINFSLQGKYLVVIMPEIHVSTGQAYSGIYPSKPNSNLKKDLETLEFSEFQSVVKNDFEKSVFGQFPALVEIKEALLNAGAVYSSMSGSGSAIFGVFESKPEFTSVHSFQVFEL